MILLDCMEKHQLIIIFFILGVTIILFIPILSVYHLRSDFDKLEEEKNRLQNENVFLKSLTIPDGLDQHYEKIRNENTFKHSSRGDLGWNLLNVMTILHDLGDINWSTPYTDFKTTHNITCSILTSNFIRNILKLICDKGTEEEILITIYNWINQNIHYVKDEWGYARFPIETIVRGYGDCEDQAAALSVLLENNGFQTALGLIHDENLTDYGKVGLYHTFCLVKIEGFQYNGSRIELIDKHGVMSQWIILDPTYNQVFGEDPIWLKHYKKNIEIIIPTKLWNYIIVDFELVIETMSEINID